MTRIKNLALALAFAGGLCGQGAVAQNPDLRSCGLVWVRDEGGMSVWRATRMYTSVGVMSQDSNGRWVESVIALSSGNEVAIRIGSQRARCLS